MFGIKIAIGAGPRPHYLAGGDTEAPVVSNVLVGTEVDAGYTGSGDVPVSFDLSDNVAANCTVYYVAYPSGDTAPEQDDVLAGNTFADVAADASGTIITAPGSGVTNTDAIPDGVNGTYRLAMVAVDGSGNAGPVATSNPVAINTVTYSQNIYVAPTTANNRLNFSPSGLPSTDKLTVSMWLNFPATDSSRFFGTNGGLDWLWDRDTGATSAFAVVRDSAATDLLSTSSPTGILPASQASGTLSHWQCNIDLSVPDITIWVNSVDVTGSLTISAGNGVITWQREIWLAMEPNLEFSDVVVNFGSLIPNATLYNGGTPPDLGTKAGGAAAIVSGAQFIIGGDMVAADLNAGTNIGSGSVSKQGAVPFTDWT